MNKHSRGDEVEPVTYPGYTVATRKRKRKELTDQLDKTLSVGRFAVIDIPNDDIHYKLRFGLGKITKVYENCIDFEWYTYAGYPDDDQPDYTKWKPQILAGRGQRIDKGWCRPASVVLTFPKLTSSRRIPNVGRTAPLKMISRALDGEFGPLPQDMSDMSETDRDDEYVESHSEAVCASTRVTRSFRGKRRAK